MVEIGHVNIGIIFLCIGKSQWWLYNILSIPSNWLFDTQSRVLQACWSIFKNNELLTLTCPINPTWITLCFQFLIVSPQQKSENMAKDSFKPVSTSHQCRELIYMDFGCSYLHCCPDYSHAWATAIALSNYMTLKHKNRVEVISRQYFVIFNKQALEFKDVNFKLSSVVG